MLSLYDHGNGIPIARINGGKFDKEVIYIEEQQGKKQIKSIELPQGKVEPIPNPYKRGVLFISGPSGVGKSVYANMYARNYKKLFPEKNVYVFSRLDKDESLDRGLNPIRIPLDESLIDGIDIQKDLADGALVIFDDCDTIKDKKIRDACSGIQNDLLETGRHVNVYVIVISHLLNGNDRKNSRTILNEATEIVVFPHGGSTYQINYCLKNYLGFSKYQITDILQTPSRWITIKKNYPQAIFYETGAYLVN